MATIQQTDPTQTKILRKQFSSEMYKRWRKVKGLVRKSIVDNDVFNLKESVFNQEDITREEMKEEDEDTESAAFMSWLEETENKILLGAAAAGTVGAADWWGKQYTDRAYVRGYKSAGERMRKIGTTVPEMGRLQIRQQPSLSRQLNQVASKTLSETKGVMSQTNQQIKRELFNGLRQGNTVSEIANNINDRIDKIGITRSKKIARTETVRSYAEATLDRYEDEGLDQVTTKAEFTTAGDSRVCPTCSAMEGNVYNISEARGLIPVHPLCRCAWLPVREDNNGST